MSIVLDGLELNDSMEWLERFQSSRVAQSVRNTLGGRAVVFAGSILSGHAVTLEATEDHGWLTKLQVESLLTKAAVPGAVYSLTYGGQTFNVMFRHNEAPAVDFTPIVSRQAQADGDYMYGSIKLIRV